MKPPPKLPSSRPKVKATLEKHKCIAHNWLMSDGYGHSVKECIEDQKGFLWLTSHSGRKMTNIAFCPFCGFQALRPPEKLKSTKLAKGEVLLPTDRPDAVWKRFNPPFIQEHFQFGIVRVKASDGVHSKIILPTEEIVTVHNNNLKQPAGIPLAVKVGTTKDKQKSAKALQKEQDEAERLAKYMAIAANF